jgi:hypothetical protein
MNIIKATVDWILEDGGPPDNNPNVNEETDYQYPQEIIGNHDSDSGG